MTRQVPTAPRSRPAGTLWLHKGKGTFSTAVKGATGLDSFNLFD